MCQSIIIIYSVLASTRPVGLPIQIFHPSTNNFYTTMSVGRALLLNPDYIVYLYFYISRRAC